MAKLGTKKKPANVRVQTEKGGQEIASIFNQHGWQYIVGLEPGKPENISDLEKLLKQSRPEKSRKKLDGMIRVPVEVARSLKRGVDKNVFIMILNSFAYRDREEPHSSPLPHHLASALGGLRGSADPR